MKSKDKIYYNIKTNSINMTNELDNFDRTWIKPVCMCVPELDKMVNFIKLSESL